MPYLPGGVFVTLEGIDGAGKTTQLRALAARYAQQGYPVSCYREPGESDAGLKLREAARLGRLDAEEEHRLFLEDRRWDVERNLRPDLREGRLVLLDRYYLSNMAYQGARGLDPERIRLENEAFAPRPDVAVVLDIPVESGLGRAAKRGAHDHFERRESLERVRNLFLDFSRRYDWVKVVNANRAPEEVTEDLVRLVAVVLAKER